MLYEEAREQLQGGRYPVDPPEAAELGGLSCRLRLGPFEPGRHTELSLRSAPAGPPPMGPPRPWEPPAMGPLPVGTPAIPFATPPRTTLGHPLRPPTCGYTWDPLHLGAIPGTPPRDTHPWDTLGTHSRESPRDRPAPRDPRLPWPHGTP